MVDLNRRIRAALVWLVMAALCGLIGFVIVHHYVSNRRLNERFAIVVDAGSTQTRSSLFRLTINSDPFSGITVAGLDERGWGGVAHGATIPVGSVFRVQQIGSCVNGGPLATTPNQIAADELIGRCVSQFVKQIQMLDFITPIGGDDSVILDTGTRSLDAASVSKDLALMNHRVNSITHLHLGATAGMRALEQLNLTRAHEKLNWIVRSINESNRIITNGGPYVNTGYVGILEGSDEASFGWVSVNFVCNTLIVTAPSLHPRPIDTISSNASTIYQLESAVSNLVGNIGPLDDSVQSIGTLELGGASAQLAFQVQSNISDLKIRNNSLEEQQLNLFNGHYKLATRSDLCLGMSQAVLRSNYILIHRAIAPILTELTDTKLEITNVCLQKGSAIEITGRDLHRIWQSACLMPNRKLNAGMIALDDQIRQLAASRDSIRFSGTGDVAKCDELLNELVQPVLCQRYFAFCPASKITAPPPASMPFVTISGYNHALKVLGLEPTTFENSTTNGPSTISKVIDEVIDERLGGRPVNYKQFEQKTRDYCSIDVSELAGHFPKVTKQYQNIICLQLVYIRKLLVEFYQLKPSAGWNQIRFLIFEPGKLKNQQNNEAHSSKLIESQPDIGWTLGLLLNATSQQLESSLRDDLYHHHGASPMYLVRTTILLVVACALISVALLVSSAVQIANAKYDVGTLQSESPSSSSSTYQIGNLGYSITYPPNYNSFDHTLHANAVPAAHPHQCSHPQPHAHGHGHLQPP